MIAVLVVSVMPLFPAAAQTLTDTIFVRADRYPLMDGQQYHTDTMIIDPNDHKFLVGTTVLKGSDRNEFAASNGYALREVSVIPCSASVYNPAPNHVESINAMEDVIEATLSINANCCHSFLGEINIENDSTLNFIYHGYGEACTCSCCFGLKYEIIKWGSSAKPVRFAMINGDRKTLVPIIKQ